MAPCRAMGRNVASVICLTALLLYIAYFTSELYTRLNNIRKLERLNEYERELTELTRILHRYKSDSKIVSKSVALLQEVITKMAEATRQQKSTKDYVAPKKFRLSYEERHQRELHRQRERDIHKQEALLNRPLKFDQNTGTGLSQQGDSPPNVGGSLHSLRGAGELDSIASDDGGHAKSNGRNNEHNLVLDNSVR